MTLRALVSAVDGTLRPLNFARRKSTWNRREGVLIDVVDLQVAKAGDAILVNAGVLHQRAYALCWSEGLPAFADEADCTVRLRHGGSSRTVRDESIELADVKGAEKLIVEVETRILPFLRRMHDPVQMETYLRQQWKRARDYPPISIYLAALASERGDRTEACAMLRKLAARRLPAWKSRVDVTPAI